MQLLIINGSPRGKRSNSSFIIGDIVSGFEQNQGCSSEILYLNRLGNHEEVAERFSKAKNILLVFPLYADSMPGIVMNFISQLEPHCGKLEGTTLGFVIHSGFSEPVHSRAIEKYCEKLCKRLGCSYSGSAVKAGSEGFRLMPPWMTRKVSMHFQRLGRRYFDSGKFDPQIVKALAPKEHFSGISLLLQKFLVKSGIGNMYWNSALKKNKVYEKRFARPYVE